MVFPPKVLKSTNVLDYTYICLFMLTYRKTTNKFFNAIIRDRLVFLKDKLGTNRINIKTINILRKELVTALNKRYLPEMTITPNDPIDLMLIITCITSNCDLSLSEQFFEDLDSAQQDIADAIDHLNQKVIDFFLSLKQRDLLIYSHDINFILTLVIDFLRLFLPSWESTFDTIKQALLYSTFSRSFSVPLPFQTYLDQATVPVIPAISPDIVSLISSMDNFVLITPPFTIHPVGNPKKSLIPEFEVKLREFFSRSYSI